MKSFEHDPRLLKPNPWNSNKVSPGNMEKLEKSVRELGFAGAVVVRETDDGYQILGGEHRTQIAIKIGLKTVPVVNVGAIDDVKARKISLANNLRSGNDDTIQLAKILEEIGESAEELSSYLPIGGADIEAIIGAVNLDLEDFDIDGDDDHDEPDPDAPTQERKEKTHDVLKFRVRVQDADPIRLLIEKTIKSEGLKGGDDMTTAGEALALLLVKGDV